MCLKLDIVYNVISVLVKITIYIDNEKKISKTIY